MPRVFLKNIYGFSSEDSNFPASNLLKNLKWKSQGVGQDTEHVTLELEKSTAISGIDLGNEASCFMSVFVARRGQEMFPDKYKEILMTSSFMTPIDCRLMTNTNGMRCFKKENLVKDVVREKWDFVKIVCSQPFNTQIQYGLSFITIYKEEDQDKDQEEPEKVKKTSSFGRFQLREESPERDEDSGKLFNKWKQSQQSSSSGAFASVFKKASKEPTAVLQDINSPRKNRIVAPEGRDAPEAKKPKISKKPVGRISNQPFSKLLNRVVFAISGIKNPERGTIRQKAIEMGARYNPDWDRSCTHLISAFKNTPKADEARGLGKIVKKDWILDCYTKRIRFPWRRYAVDPSERNESESEDEVYEETKQTSQSSRTWNRIVDSGSDTEDEIERILAAKKQ